MKTNIKIIVGCILFAFFAMTTFGQVTTKTTKETLKKHVKLEKSKVPKRVIENYYKEYPVTSYDNWYGYPAYDYQSDWYDDWFDYNPYTNTYTEHPEYYIIESTKDKTPFKVIYNKTGAKIAVHKILKSNFPIAVLATISKGKYKTWKLANDKEEIFKDKDTDKIKVYKVAVEKGKEKHELFFQANGKLLKDKKVF
jgi:hypothetical protein